MISIPRLFANDFFKFCSALLSPDSASPDLSQTAIQTLYDTLIQKLDLSSFVCPFCDSSAFCFYGTYKRHILTGYGGERISVRFQRIICRHCGKTHALIPADLTACTCFSLDLIVLILFLLSCSESCSQISMRFGLEPERICRIRDRYKKNWKDYGLFQVPVRLLTETAIKLCQKSFCQPQFMVRGSPVQVWLCQPLS